MVFNKNLNKTQEACVKSCILLCYVPTYLSVANKYKILKKRCYVIMKLHSEINIPNVCTNSSLQNLQVPWLAVLRSKPFWAILVAHACSNWGWYMLLIELPFYMKQVLKFNTTAVIVLIILSQNKQYFEVLRYLYTSEY